MQKRRERSASPNKRKAKNSKKNDSASTNIYVAVRLRPLSQKEKYISTFETAKVLNDKYVVLLDPQYEMAPDDVSSLI